MRLYHKIIKAFSIIYVSCLSFSIAAEQPYVVSNSGFSQGQFESCASSGQYACFRVFAGRRGDNYIGGTCHTASASSTYNLGDVQVSHAIVREMAADDRADFWFNGRHFQVEGGTGGRPCELGRTSYNRPNANIGSLPQQFTVNANILVSGMGEAWGTMDVYYIPYFQDYGDAPDASNGTGPGNYRTRQADNGPSHRALRSTYEVFLGATLPDDDGSGLQNVDATADDLNAGSSYYGIAADDENGVTFPNLKYTDANYSITANVTNSSGADAYLYAWIDFDNSGTFDVDELFSSGTGSGNEFIVADGSIDTPQTLTWNSLAELTANGYYYSRVRISETQLTTTATGSAEDTRSFGASSAAGEVEDYKFCVGCVDITGYIYDDVNGDSDLADKVGVSGVSVYLYTDDGDMTPNAADGGPTLTTTTDADGYYAFVEIPGLTYFVSPNPPTSSSALAEQTYTTSQTDNTNGTFVTGYCDANADGVADTTPIAVTGACYGGWDGDRANTSSSADLSAREHISRVIFSANSNSVNQLDFGFSYNAVTNTEITGQGSLEQFIINANAIAGANNMRFVPAVAANDADVSADWWVISPTSSLTTITGTNGANTTLDGQAYSHTDGVTLLDTNSGDYAASQTVGSSHLCSVENIAALAKPELQIDLPTNASAYSAEIIIINADNTTVRNLSLTGGSQGINVYSGGITDTVIEYNLIGIDPAGNDAVIGQETCGTSSGCAGIAIANSGNSALHGNSGIIRNNAIKTAHHNISLNSLNSQTAVINWQLQHNLLLGTTSTTATPYHAINIRYGAPAYLAINGNQIENATGDGIYQANTSIVDLLQNFTSNTIINNAEDGIDIHSGKLSIIECNILNNNGDSGIAIDGNTNVEGFLITKNSFNNNVDNSIDLHNSTTGSGVSLNNDICINDTGTGANNNLARPVIYYAFIDNNDLRLIGDVCTTGEYTLEVYKANAGSGDVGSDGLSAGEGTVYLGSLTAMSGAGFDNTLTVNGVSVGDQITVIAQRTLLTSGTYLQDTSEFSANMVVDIDNKDWGDAPDATSLTAKGDYTTRRTVGGASHIVTTSGNGTHADFFLGDFVDTDIDGQPNIAADGDNLVDLADEDGVTATGFYVLNRDRDIVVTVGKHSSYSGTTFHVYGWIDWNQDGDWLDSNEQIISDTSATVGSQTYTITTPATAILGKTYARFRICSTGDCNVPTGPSIDGEVEDYGEIIISADFGDAPDTGVGIGAGNYRTTLADDGPRHSIDSDLFLGTTASDTEIDGLQNVTASGDNIDVSDDEDSLLLLPLTSGASAYNAQAVVTNNTGSTGYLYAWLDTNRDGEFDRDEFISNGSGPGGALIIADGSTVTATALVWATISSPTNNSTVYLRTRLTSTPLTDSVSGAVEDPRSYGYANGGEVEDYALQVADQDFGDLDDTFATLGLSGGPYHGLSNKTNIYIGSATIDTEGDGQPSTDADADDITDSADENAFSSPTPILPLTASTYSVYVPVRNNTSTDAYLYGWLDWNQNNQFEAEEYAVVTVPHGTTTSLPITLTFSNISGQTEGRAALRLRYTTAGLSNIGWGGGAPDGEVEDHYIVVGSYDFGDAPDTVNGVGANNQRTLLRDDGPRHGIDNQLFFGAGVDAEQDANNPANRADGDDIDANGDDEDGALLIPLHNSATSYTLPITVTNTTSSDAYIYAWIDFDRTTGFDRDEFAGGTTGVPITVAAGTVNGAVSINWNSLPGIAINTDVYIRLRLTTDNLPDTATGTQEDPRSYGSATDGEVEDYYLRVDTYDGGDAPNIYHTRYTSNGPSHYHTNTNLYIRNATHDDVHDLDGQPNNAADGDDIDGSDDENSDDLTRIPLLGLSDTTYTLGVPLYNGTGVNANLYGWIDFNKNGRFDDDGEFAALESIANSTNTSNQAAPTTTLTWDNFSGQAQGSTYVRLRITNDILTKDDWGGMALNGEVEDHQVFIGDFDFGDAPDTANGVSANNYRTHFNDNGAYHGFSNQLYLGPTAPDTENDANAPAIKALGDDNDVNGDDEDGVYIMPLHTSLTSYSIRSTVTNNTGSDAYLYAWIDFDRNGHFDRDEFAGGAAGVPITVSSGVTNWVENINWTQFPGMATNTDVYVRVRLTTDLLSDAVTGTTEDPRSYGGVSNGEVEDHYLRVDTYDGGDLPETFNTSYNNGGPAHYHTNIQLYIRSATHDDVHDQNGQPTPAANGDDNDGSDDENGDELTPFPILTLTDNSYTLAVPLYNGTGVNAHLYGWLDLNQDGNFDETNEFVALEDIVNGTNTSGQTSPTTILTWNNISGQKIGNMGLRLRLTSEKLTAAQWGGFAENGEVEDHFIYVGDPDFGDAPDTSSAMAANNYQTRYEFFGPYHLTIAGLYIGNTAPDTDDGTLQNAIATADDDDAIDDEGPIILPPLFNTMTTYKAIVPVTNTTGSDATLAAWIDFNRNGKFEDNEGQLAVVSTGATNTPVELEWTSLPSISNNTTSFIRLRLTNRLVTQISDISSLGGEAGGEIEDHSIFFGLQDQGDAPSTYLVDPLLGGPHHIITNATHLHLGNSTIDGDSSIFSSSDALGDDNDGSNDENATTQPLTSIPVNGASHQLELTLRNTTGNDAYLAGWIDSNRNGVFDEIEGRVDVIPTGQNGAYTYSFDANQMENLSVGNSYIRFRLTTDLITVTDVGGGASDGEVEDFMIQIGGQDLGDLPDTSTGTAANNYQTNLTYGGPYHNVAALSELYLGDVAPDVDGPTPQTTLADGDDADAIDDENALADIPLPDIDAGDPFNTLISVTNNTNQVGYLYAWIDWDRDGSFESDEIAQAAVNSSGTVQAITNGMITIAPNSGRETYNVSFITDTALVDARTYGVRLRVTSEVLIDGDASASIDERSLGAAKDGEVEDFFITAENTDLGDLPDTYLTLPTSGGPAHYYVSSLYMGANNIDDDDQAYIDAAAMGDDNSANDDENGIEQPLATVATSITEYSIDVAITNTSGSMATLVAWLDHNQDGSFTANEVVDELNVATTGIPFTNTIFNQDNFPTGNNNLTNKVTLKWNNISGLQQGTMGLRIRVANSSLTANDWGGIAQGGEVEDYVVYVGQFDFGDAKDTAVGIAANNYRTTLSDNGAYHGVTNTIFLGATVDAEADANDPTTAFALGDDITGADEDGVFVLPLNNTNTEYSLPVTLTNNSGKTAYLYAWIDFDRNGRFDRDEFYGGNTGLSTDINSGSTNIVTNLNWTSFPGIATNTDVYIRVRFTTDILADTQINTVNEDPRSLGGASDGEVEDYYVRVDTYDGGDAPNIYHTLYSSGGPYHVQNHASLYIRDATHDDTHDQDGQPTSAASGDDNDGKDDENADDLTPFPILSTASSSYTLGVPINNATGQEANLYGWIDLNQDGRFDGANEFAELSAISSGTNTSSQATSTTELTWSGFSGLNAGRTYMRLRLTNSVLTANDWGGPAENGEVEDHVIYIGDLDFGDAEDSAANTTTGAGDYRSRREDHGPYHVISNDLYMGQAVPDSETNANPSSANTYADGDDNTASDDEDGVTLRGLDNSPVPTSYTAMVKVTNNTGKDAYLYGWIDWDRNGQFESDEVAQVTVADGTNGDMNLDWSNFPGIVAGFAVARFRLTTDSLDNQNTAAAEDTRSLFGASDGEVEDHRIYIGDQDYGDAPDDYKTTSANNGAHHGLGHKSTVYLGTATIDADSDGIPSSDASSDDLNGSDDENGLPQPLANIATSASDYSVTVSFKNSRLAGQPATLVAWLDSDQDGEFSAAEVVSSIDYDATTPAIFSPNNIPYFNGNKTAQLRWTGLSGLTNGAMALRIRFSSQTELTAADWAGQALDGEVEDYMVYIGEFDYGDAPDEAINVGANNYRTTQSDSGPFHGIDSNLFLGSLPDAESDALATIALQASGDDTTLNDDEDGMVLPPLTTRQGRYSANVMVTNNTGSDSYIYAWIDFDGNGRFDRDEFIGNGTAVGDAVIVPTGTVNKAVALNWLSTPGLAANVDRYLRVRISSDLLADTVVSTNEDPRSYGGVTNGEVEDHYLLSDNVYYDGGDAPTSYGVRFADGGPLHPTSTILRIGTAATDGEDAQASDNATLDDTTATNDENGLTLSVLTTASTSYTLDANVLNNIGADADLIVWIDWDRSGEFDSTEAQSVTISPSSSYQVQTPTWNSISPTAGYYFGRARLMPTNDGFTNTSVGGMASAGEVEDFRITLLSGQDWGDAPDSYHTIAANDGANHVPSSTLYIGNLMADADVNGQPSTDALNDDDNGTADETPPSFPALSPSMTTWTFDTPVTNTTGAAATLHAWVDHDRDGEFQLDEYTSVAVANGASNQNVSLTWNNLSAGSGGDIGDTYIRLRLTSDTLTDDSATLIDERSYGAATDGEVEDHYHKVTFHMLIQRGSGSIQYTLPTTTNNTVALMENNYGVGYVSYDILVPNDNIVTDFTLPDYQFVLYQSDRAGGISTDSMAEIDALLAYRNQGGVLLSIVEGDRFADATSTKINTYMGQQAGFPGTSATAFAGYVGPTQLPRFHSSDGPGGLSNQLTVQTTGSLSTITGIDHRSVIYTLPEVTGSCNNVDAMAWLIPYAPTSTGGYVYPRSHVGPWIGSGERQFYFTPSYTTHNVSAYQELMDFVHDYYEDTTAFTARNNWLADPANVNGSCSSLELDFGDLPDTGVGVGNADYITAYQFDGPRHDISQPIYLGTPPDGETDAYATIAANGDSDDGIEILPLSSTATQYSVRVTSTNTTGTDGTVYGWADWNLNGDLEASELQTLVVADGDINETNILTWSVPATLTNSDTIYMRFRVCNTTTDCSSPIGEASNGEVEDYALIVSDNVDYGDAPDIYGTLAGNGGPFHFDAGVLFVGDQSSDFESDGMPSVLANGDDNQASPDDEDGINVISPININASDYSLTVEATNNSGAMANLIVWVDFDKSGKFDPDEAQVTTVADGVTEGQYSFNWTGLTGLTAGVTYARVRITTDAISATSTGGIANDGEVEDHLVVMGTFDLGDAPDTYGTDRSDADGEGVGPMHIPTATIYLGTNATDTEANGFVDGVDDNGLAQDDDVAGVDDEDSIVSATTLMAVPGSNETLTVHVNTDVDATVYAWLDFDRDGRFDLSTEAATPVVITAADDNTDIMLNFTTPADVLDGGSYVRIRMCSTATQCSTPHGMANDGEVEDHRIMLDVGYDYGDAPQTLGYDTLFTANGARHRIGNTTLRLGAILADSDDDGFGDGIDDNFDATDDDVTDNADEDAIATVGFLSQGATSFTQLVSCNDHTGSVDIGANVYAWGDFNADGDFADSGEFSQAPCVDADAVTEGSATLTFTAINTSTTATQTYLRLRITSETLTMADYNGTAINGEVEDHQIPILKGPIQPISPAVVASQCINTANIEGEVGTPVDITGVVNTYYPATASALTGTNTIELGAATGDTSKTLNPGDRIMIIQIQNTTLDTSNTDSYGSGQAGGYGSGWLNYGNSGQYELATVVNYNAPTLVISENLTNNFVVNSQSSYQVVRVPMYEDVRLTGTITAADWNGSSGGIVALFVNGSLDLNGNTIDVNGKGFRGGKLNTSNGIATGLNYVLSASNIDGGKGEGIAGTPIALGGNGYTNGDYGVGAPANAGGGGNFNSGGGGGANVGPGGRGGNYGNAVIYYPGEPGTGFGIVDDTRLLFGGGGGAGQQNNSAGRDGADGGGIVYINAATITGSGMINANGNQSATAGGDSPGGGGAGGTVTIYNQDGATLAGLTVNAIGGNGVGSSGGHGQSAAGGGGGVIFNSSGATVNISGGNESCSGQLLCGDEGGNGGVVTAAPLPTAPALCSFNLSGFVFDDSSTAPSLNGIKDPTEAGLGVAVPVIAHNLTTNLCYVATADATTGEYNMVIPGGNYHVYEAALEMDLITPTCPPTAGVLNTTLGEYIGATIGDPANTNSSSSNVQAITIFADTTDVNFADFAITAYPTCSSDGYLLRNSPTDITSINLALGQVTPLYDDVLPTATGVFGGTGYNVITNTLIGDNIKNKDTILMVDGSGTAFVLPITNSSMALNNYNSGDIDDNGVLLLMNNSGTSMYRIDVNPNSVNYLRQIDELSVSAPTMADMSINPIDNMLYTLTPTGSLVKFDPITGTRTNLGSVGGVGTTSSGWGAIYFDDQGFMYAAQNPNPGRIIRIDLSDPSLTAGNYTAVDFTQMNTSTGQNDGARCRFAPMPLDFGDAPEIKGYSTTLTDNGPRHLTDTAGLYLGTVAPDNENDGQPSTDFVGDDDNGLAMDDEDVLSSLVTLDVSNATVTQVIPMTNTTGNDAYVSGWVDFDNNGTFENDESAWIIAPSGSSTVTLTWNNVGTTGANISNSVTGYRLRISSDFNSTTNVALDTNSDGYPDPTGPAADGEVEDHRIFVSNLNGDTSCNIIIETHENTSNGIDYTQLDPSTRPAQLTTLVTPIAVAGYPDAENLNGIGFNRQNGLFYGVFYDTSTADENVILFVTDRDGTDFVPLGAVRASNSQTVTHTANGSASFSDNQPLSRLGGGINLEAITLGDVSIDGQYLYVMQPQWNALVRIELSTQTFTTIPLSATVVLGDDFSFSEHDNFIYSIDFSNDKYIKINPLTGNVTEKSLQFNGLMPVANTGVAVAGGTVMDNGIMLYAFTDGGNHDSTGDNTHDVINKAAIYQLNVITGDLLYISAMTVTSLSGQDTAGCYSSRDYGDADVSYGAVYHNYSDIGNDGDAAFDGDQDLTLGNQWDSELVSVFSLDATGDNLQSLNDEDGVTMPASITVATLTPVAISVPQASGFLNIFIDLNGNGNFNDPGELIVEDHIVNTASFNIDLNLDAGLTAGYNGDTVARFRLCSTASSCNTAIGEAVDGEVEDYQFELINQIILGGFVFEDNGINAATAAHDGIMDGQEQGIGDVTVNVIYNGAGAHGYTVGDIIATTQTSGDGSYLLVIPVLLANEALVLNVVQQARWIDISEADVTTLSQVTNSSVIDSQMLINASAGDYIMGLNFGKVQEPRMEPDNYTELEPGNVALFKHKFTSDTAGDVTLTIMNPIGSPPSTAWAAVLYQDANCNGIIDGSDMQISASISVSGNTNICLISKVFTPVDAPLNASYDYDIYADMVFADTASTGHGITRQVIDSDTVRVSFSGAGELKLNKTVANISQATTATVSNQGKPGDILEYTIEFINVGTGVVTDINIYDTTAAYTQLAEAVDCTNAVIPAGLMCQLLLPVINNTGYVGDIQWQLTGSLQPNQTGEVSYRVIIE